MAAWSLSCSIWALVPWPGIKPWLPALGARRLSHWATREVPKIFFFKKELTLVFAASAAPASHSNLLSTLFFLCLIASDYSKPLLPLSCCLLITPTAPRLLLIDFFFSLLSILTSVPCHEPLTLYAFNLDSVKPNASPGSRAQAEVEIWFICSCPGSSLLHLVFL